MHFLEWKYINLIKISLKFVPKGPINNIPASVQIMAWHRPGDKPLSEPMMLYLLMHISLSLKEFRPFFVVYLLGSMSPTWHAITNKVSAPWRLCHTGTVIETQLLITTTCTCRERSTQVLLSRYKSSSQLHLPSNLLICGTANPRTYMFLV